MCLTSKLVSYRYSFVFFLGDIYGIQTLLYLNGTSDCCHSFDSVLQCRNVYKHSRYFKGTDNELNTNYESITNIRKVDLDEKTAKMMTAFRWGDLDRSKNEAIGSCIKSVNPTVAAMINGKYFGEESGNGSGMVCKWDMVHNGDGRNIFSEVCYIGFIRSPSYDFIGYSDSALLYYNQTHFPSDLQ